MYKTVSYLMTDIFYAMMFNSWSWRWSEKHRRTSRYTAGTEESSKSESSGGRSSTTCCNACRVCYRSSFCDCEGADDEKKNEATEKRIAVHDDLKRDNDRCFCVDYRDVTYAFVSVGSVY